MSSNIGLEVQNPSGFTTIPEKKDIQNWVNACIQREQKKHCSIVIRFVDKEESENLNSIYRKKNSATNVLSFPAEYPEFMLEIAELEEESAHIGDLVLCESVVTQEAIEQNKTLEQHWAHLIVHGCLHLQGYDHIEDADADIMVKLEIEILHKLGFANPY